MGAVDLLYIWQQAGWPILSFDYQRAGSALSDARRMQGVVEGKAQGIGIVRDGQMARELMEHEVIATAAIEGETLDPSAVRSSVMRRLGLASTGPHDRHIDGLVDVINDATCGFDKPLDDDRLHRWQAALFPGGTSGIRRIAVGRYRDHTEPMQIVSGPPGKEIIHYEAPPSPQVAAEMTSFLDWFAGTTPVAGRSPEIDGLARAAIAHLWFESIHPYKDGNGRIGRAIVDMAIAQDHRSPVRLYSLSHQLLESRHAYYDALNAAQRGTGDATDWVVWFAHQYARACERSSTVIHRAIEKARFWADHAGIDLNERQRKVLQRLLDDGDGGFLGELNAEKYTKLTGTSKASATGDLAELVRAGLLWDHRPGQGHAPLRQRVGVEAPSRERCNRRCPCIVARQVRRKSRLPASVCLQPAFGPKIFTTPVCIVSCQVLGKEVAGGRQGCRPTHTGCASHRHASSLPPNLAPR